MNVTGIDHLELFVADLHRAAHWLCDGFGFQVVGDAGSQALGEHRHSQVLQQGSIRLVVTAADHPTDEVSGYVELHEDGIRDIAFRVPDATEAFREAVRLGARPLQEPVRSEDAQGRLIRAIVSSPVGDVVHSLIQREAPESQFWPGRFQMREGVHLPSAPMMVDVDHLALCVAPGSLVQGVEFYERVFGFRQSHEENVETAYSGMNSRVVQDAAGRACLVLMEPMAGKRQGQIDRFLLGHRGPGVQHLAFRSGDILGTVKYLRDHQVSLLESPPGYYERLPQRVRLEDVGEDWQQLRDGCVLVDHEGSGYLLQVFTRSAHPRRTLFFEVTQRKSARGFGAANIRALYEAVEQELGHG
ncbi:4-hydroxyphenylpyruvate dioxygenase [Hyalangium versicolor]|uniref:4-hydroxyphenylpyruvate dioxygenase n=1 Tax=Hyalangium versicolor TaxID=2861190 RepID=UPI001CCAE088|nr:4-hydroxyphenylpyruvate dioxygenase [Hyalangium versicolor]